MSMSEARKRLEVVSDPLPYSAMFVYKDAGGLVSFCPELLESPVDEITVHLSIDEIEQIVCDTSIPTEREPDIEIKASLGAMIDEVLWQNACPDGSGYDDDGRATLAKLATVLEAGALKIRQAIERED